MSMTPAEAVTAIQAQFKTVWGIPGSPLSLAAFDNVDFDASSINVPWVRVSIQFTGGSIQTLGGVGERTFRNNGLVFVQVFTITGSGVVVNNTLAESAKNAFKGIQLAGSLWFRDVQIISIGNEGKWYQQNVSADFIYDETE